jgi:hypothetical protein
MIIMYRRLLLNTLLLTVLPLAALAQPVPPDFSYQGQLLDASDVPLAGPASIQIRLYEVAIPVSGETPLFIEDHMGTPLTNGVFTIRVGAGTPVLGTMGPKLFSQANRFLELHVNGERLLPRQAIGSVPYSFKSGGLPRAFDAAGNELGFASFNSQDVYDSTHVVFLPGPDLTLVFSGATGDVEERDLAFLQSGCTGQAYSGYSFWGDLFLNGPGGGYFVRSGPLTIHQTQSALEASTGICRAVTHHAPLWVATPLDPSTLPFTLPVATPISVSSE